MSVTPKEVGARVARESRTVAQGFAQFLLRGKVVDLAVAVAIGASAGTVITTFVKNVFTPLVAALFGNHSKLGDAYFSLRGNQVRYGDFLSALISFLIIAIVVYFFVITPTNKLVTNAYFEPPPDPATRKCPECLSDIPKPARRCAYCTATVDPLDS
ncbi:MAG: MscL family protein [Candidatus Eremiobacteraeota bacterium]|nr:MscL family protein [Candidatus Eremiobacteraeota bacterium]